MGSHHFFQLTDSIVELSANILDAVSIAGHGIQMRNVDKNEGNIEFQSQIFVPLYHAVADIIAAQQKIGERNLNFGAFLEVCISKVDSCVGADIGGVTHTFCMLAHALSAALCAKAGMDRMEALRAITLTPARLCGLDGRVGSLEVGKDADMVLWDNDPLELFSRVLGVYINGEQVQG